MIIRKSTCFVAFYLGSLLMAPGHSLIEENDHDTTTFAPSLVPPDEIVITNPASLNSAVTKANIQLMASSFGAFKPRVRHYWDESWFYIESDGIAEHEMMTGITAWQQQIPIPQFYYASMTNKDTGNPNVWQIPINPVPAEEPLSLKEHFFRGAVAIGANGVPIFNPIKNDGVTDTVVAGELDNWGGHGGRADDYHYHIAPLHLESVLGKDKPTAFALDGYAIFGLTEPDGSTVVNLDEEAGHEHGELGYHYHAQENYPYIQAAFHGQVSEVDGQVDPQPFASRLRDSGLPLNGAEIVGFSFPAEDEFRLTYRLNSQDYEVNYQLDREAGRVSIQWGSPNGTNEEVYENWMPAETSTATSLSIRKNGIFPILDLSGQADRGITIETSNDLQTWTPGFWLLDETGSLEVEVAPETQKTFFRGR